MKLAIWILLFVLLATFGWHSLDSINQDIGRHLKLGELIWQNKSVPATNLFSYTEPNHPFINHHWLSEVSFYWLNNWFGLKGLIIFKVLILLAALALVVVALYPLAGSWPLIIATLAGILLIRERTDVRPEIFSYLFLAIFLFVSLRFKYRSEVKWLYALPLVQLLWTNSHIYFILGPALLAILLVDSLINPERGHEDPQRVSTSYGASRHILGWIFLSTLIATLINPAGLAGALTPLTILQHYGYSIVENQTIGFLLSYGSGVLVNNIYLFLATLPLLAIALFRLIKSGWPRYHPSTTELRGKCQHSFLILLAILMTGLAVAMVRNFALYGFSLIPILTLGLSAKKEQEMGSEKGRNSGVAISALGRPPYIFFGLILVLLIYAVASNSFYQWLPSGQRFGLSIPAGAGPAVEFIKNNQLHGPLFNNFDIGSYLIWKLYPQEKVFVDGRPEAYSVEFFNKIYKPMQEDPAQWTALSEQYKINYVIFDRHDITPWAQTFLQQISTNPDWPMVYLDDYSVIFLRRTPKNLDVINKSP